MAKQLELRRGTTQANNLFTGVVGEVTMDTDTKQLRVHDGVKTGGYAVDTLVAFQAPSAGNNYTWYRKYASGWVEQGGMGGQTGSSPYYITLPVQMASTDYWVTSQWRGASATDSGAAQSRYNYAAPYSTTQIEVGGYNTTAACIWEVKGMAA